MTIHWQLEPWHLISDFVLEQRNSGSSDVDINLLSRPVPTGTSAGCVKGILLKELGLTKDAIIVSVGHDQIAAAIGAGVFDSNTAVDGAGTVECITPVLKITRE